MRGKLVSIWRKLKEKRGVSDIVSLASAIIATVVVCVIGVYIASTIYDATSLSSDSPFNTAMNSAVNIMNSTFPLIVVVVVAIIAGIIMAHMLGAFGGRRR